MCVHLSSSSDFFRYVLMYEVPLCALFKELMLAFSLGLYLTNIMRKRGLCYVSSH